MILSTVRLARSPKFLLLPRLPAPGRFTSRPTI
jgi:hypothetical protein